MEFVSPRGICFDCTPGGNSPQRAFSLPGNLLKSETVYPQITQRGGAATKEFYIGTQMNTDFIFAKDSKIKDLMGRG
jgi:hypothetical protein